MNATQPEANNGQENDEQRKPEKFFGTLWRSIKRESKTAKFWIELVAVSGGLFYAGITYYMWQDSHRNFAIDQRAWISATSAVPAAANQGTVIEGDVTIFNSGKTIAHPLFVECVVMILRNTEPVPFDYGRTHVVTDIGILGPNSNTPVPCSMGAPDQSEVFTKTQADDLLNGRAYLAVYGRGRYNDIFGDTHWLQFCHWKYYYTGNSNYNARNCTDYNDTGDGPTKK